MDIDIFNETQYCIDKIKKKYVDKFKIELENGTLNIIPSKLKFTFDSDNFKIQEKTIEIANYFSKSCPIQFLPLETQYFKIKNISQVSKELKFFDNLFDTSYFI